ncbi:transglycosylase domain-containing protein [Clostridium saccharobutylicum]|uniref:Penicillin-binding protein 1A n=1 Tax=Clostridium saccharobutylicum DSM 13864 TaxID=1345695 RepID=U5MTE0_CLOSA|nr:biosynthetic peptidoglycan transglycosylase [Clostridium saccharobutylicum]AGX43865.1 penicillin-binding protein 4 [Clostridium saccharobutylicum DSM 13864]AQR91166.1 penicillin-binding protein 1F [Clostridium saccharobutylicum]AQS01070.1 penicillin-binding protein 1F [Clostridium saccharobutylicum]AQS10805.1 penicillin-binding protein 1F [Clostridium saccharobutylicum]AQS15053.1 penicillin-binding protein 1F [Clostridium saccharobutylicum]
MKKKKNNRNNFKNKTLSKVLHFLIIIIILISGFIYFKYWPTISFLYNDATKKVNNCTIDTFNTNKSNNLNTLNNKDPLYLKSSFIPQDVKNAFIAIEDKDFYNHGGVSVKAVFRSIYSIFTNDWRITQGGSTITQQLSRNVFLNFDKNYERKVEEMFIATKLEQKFTKDQILEFYINNIYFSNNAYGLNTAAKKFFNKDCRELNLSQICFLVAIPNEPQYYDPIKHLDNTLQRRNLVLEKMKEYNYITDEQYKNAINYKIILNTGK